MTNFPKIQDLYDLTHTAAAPLLSRFTYPWEALDSIASFIRELGAALPSGEYDHPKDDVWIARSAKVAPTAFIGGPCIIGPETEVRHCAFIRGSALVGAGCVIGNSTELKNVILFDSVQVPHYNYIGDSILGYHAHLGAGAVTSNVKSDNSNVTVRCGCEKLETGRRKFGAMLGDRVEVGCNSVLCPGCVIGPDSMIYPLSRVRGVIGACSIYKDSEHVVPREP